jgi:hypothetical protein
VLANLPKTRPQRSSPRRTAARGKSAAATTAEATAGSNVKASPAPRTKPAKPVAKRPRAKARVPAATSTKKTAARTPLVKTSRQTTARPKTSPKELPAVPLQGYASEGDRATGAVQAPGGTELVGSAAEILGELAKVGISTGERLLRDVFSRLPGI